MIDPALYDQARDRIAANGFTPEIQTKITLLLCTAKNGNLMFHSSVQWMQNLNVVQQFILSQYSRELEAVTLLSRTTQWSKDPTLALEGSRIVAPLMMAWGQIMLPPGPMLNPQATYRGISLGHAQLARIRQAGIPLTVCVDKVAASGGYMMACIGDKILSAPFAILGSIGVVAQLPNVHRLLKKHEIDFEVLTAGEYKRTLTVFGENTDKGREKFQEDLETTHELFKGFVARYRPQLSIDEVATGEVWLGMAALDKLLVDDLQTSDEYLGNRAREAELFHLHYAEKKSLQERFGIATSVALDRVLLTWWSRLNQQRFWQ